jgi:citrate lyase subunit beta/citryl-CoA lyase
MSARGHIIRTLVFVAAYDEEIVQRAAESGADAVCLDMEDLTPESLKPRAREVFAPLARDLAAAGVAVMARTNRLDSGHCEADLDAIVGADLHCVNIPKTESAADVVEFCRLLGKAEATNGVAAGTTLVRPVIETAAGVKWAYEIAAASERITYMGGVAGGYWGDLGASVGVIPSDDGVESLFLRSKVLSMACARS